MAAPITTTFDLLRHGEPVGGRKYRGQADDPLSDRGWEQMWQATGRGCPWDAIISSTLCRCADFARALATRTGLPLELVPQLMEIGFGAWEGHTAAELTAADPDCLSRFWSDPQQHRPPGAETLTAFRDRVVGTWTELLDRYRGRHLLIVAHAGVIRMLIRHNLDMPLDRLFRIQVPAAGMSRITVDETANGRRLPRLVFHGR